MILALIKIDRLGLIQNIKKNWKKKGLKKILNL